MRDRRRPETVPEHGTRSRYQGSLDREGCRCRACREANAAYMRGWRNPTRIVPRWMELRLWPDDAPS